MPMVRKGFQGASEQEERPVRTLCHQGDIHDTDRCQWLTVEGMKMDSIS